MAKGTSSPARAVRQRRRGPELEAALLEAAWEDLTEIGFAKLTMESVAARANTGIAVLYRRWPNKEHLVLAALEHHRASHPIDLPDTGTLRGDLVAALTGMGRTRAAFFTTALAAVSSGLLPATGLTMGQLRARILGDRASERVRTIYRRAHARGEIDLDRIPAAVLPLPFDLVRHDLLMDPRPLTPARIRTIVDDIVLPLLRHAGEGADCVDRV